jgi:hypothetical protein
MNIIEPNKGIIVALRVAGDKGKVTSDAGQVKRDGEEPLLPERGHPARLWLIDQQVPFLGMAAK